MNNQIDHFKTAMQDAGIIPPDEIIGDGALHRFKINGKQDGAYCLHLDGKAAGYFEDFRQGIKRTWKQKGDSKSLSNTERQAFAIERQRQAEVRQAEQTARHDESAKKSLCIWSHATPAPANNPYLLKKRITPHSARLGRDKTLIIPLFNANKELINLQFISETGTKRFLSGGKKKGCFYCLGDTITNKVLICEGFATGASLHEDSGYLTVIAFDAGNLKEAAISIKSLYPDADIIICGDNDLSGIGQRKAIEAALAISGKYIFPPTVGHDFNDYLNMEVAA